jgi:hypothetical protein
MKNLTEMCTLIKSNMNDYNIVHKIIMINTEVIELSILLTSNINSSIITTLRKKFGHSIISDHFGIALNKSLYHPAWVILLRVD